MILLGWQSLLALLMVSDALATQPLIADPMPSRDLEIRQADPTKCDLNGYTSLNGLRFTTYCRQDNPFNDAQPPFKSPSFQDCMEHCSRYKGNGEGCFGAVWVEGPGDCWVRNSTTSTKSLIPKEHNFSALTVAGDMNGTDISCPGPDQSVQDLTGVEGMKYTINCGKIVDNNHDECFSGYPSCLDKPFVGFFHTKTLEECIRVCVDQHPLCRAVSWGPGLEIGFANCWPKTDFLGTLTTPGAPLGVIHSATITHIDPIDLSCPAEKSYKSAQGGKTFDLHCGPRKTSANITSLPKLNATTGVSIANLHTQNATACMDACARSDENCIGILFDSSLARGYKNCYLQNTTINTFNDQAPATWAYLSEFSQDGKPGSSSSSKAWVAGPVVGSIALLAVAAFWWRRRKASPQDGPLEKDGHGFYGAHVPAPALSPGGARGQGVQRDYIGGVGAMELNGHETMTNELPTTTKYAHNGGATHELPS